MKYHNPGSSSKTVIYRFLLLFDIGALFATFPENVAFICNRAAKMNLFGHFCSPLILTLPKLHAKMA